MPLKIQKFPNRNFLADLDTSSMTRFQMDQLMYSAVESMDQMRNLGTSLKVTVLIDSFMSNFFRVYHPKPSDRIILGDVKPSLPCLGFSKCYFLPGFKTGVDEETGKLEGFRLKVYYAKDEKGLSQFENQHWSKIKTDKFSSGSLELVAYYKDKNDWLRINTCEPHSD